MSWLFVLTIFGSIFGQHFISARSEVNNKPRASSDLWPTLNKQQPIIVAHRGAKNLMPEHTLGAYEFASIAYADYVEPDLVLTKDGRLVCFHDLSVRRGTDVTAHPEFAGYMKNFTNIIGGVNQTIYNDWFIHDFTLAELKELRVTQPVTGIRPQMFNTMFTIPTFEEYLEVIHKMAYLQNRTIGVIPELKNPAFHNSLWSPNFMEDKVLTTLKEYGYPIKQDDAPRCTHVNNLQTYDIKCGDVIIQSFEFDTIKYLNTQTDVDLLVLVDPYHLDLLTYNGMIEIASVAQHFHLGKELLYLGIEAIIQANNATYDVDHIASLGGFIPPTEIVNEGHKHNLKIGIYTIYDSHERRGGENDLSYYFNLGVDGAFVENVQEALTVRMEFDYNLQLIELTNGSTSSRTMYTLPPLVLSIIVRQFI